MPESIAYLVKGWPRRSELFIASEIRRLERLSLPIRLFVVKPPDEDDTHAIVDQIRARPVHLPATTSLSGTPIGRWLRENLPTFLPACGRVARRSPVGLARAAHAAAAQSWRARTGWSPRRIYLKELLLAIALADELEGAGDVRHLHAHFAHGATTIAWLASMITGIPFSFTGHAKDIYRGSLNPAGLLDRKLAAAAFAVTCTGANVAHLAEIAPGRAVHLVHHGLNLEFAELLARAPVPVAPDRPRLVSVGRFVAKKGHDVLLAAVAELRARGLELDVLLIGEDGDAAETIRAAIEMFDLAEVVTVRGPMSQPELLAVYRRATLFALACRIDGDGDRDGIPNVLVEAMAAGLPVVSTSVSGIPELIVSGDNGLLVPPDSPGALADAIERVVRDRAFAARIAERGTATVTEQFDGDTLARRLCALFEASVR